MSGSTEAGLSIARLQLRRIFATKHFPGGNLVTNDDLADVLESAHKDAVPDETRGSACPHKFAPHKYVSARSRLWGFKQNQYGFV